MFGSLPDLGWLSISGLSPCYLESKQNILVLFADGICVLLKLCVELCSIASDVADVTGVKRWKLNVFVILMQ